MGIFVKLRKIYFESKAMIRRGSFWDFDGMSEIVAVAVPITGVLMLLLGLDHVVLKPNHVY